MYLSYETYVSGFGGSIVPEEEFDALSRAASAVIDLLVTDPIVSVTDTVRLAAAYEIETLFAQGGTDALAGLATVTSGITEKLGDYSISTPYVANEKRCYSIGGIPVSGITLFLLKKAGLMTRCVYREETL
jgi:hypothetical protein